MMIANIKKEDIKKELFSLIDRNTEKIPDVYKIVKGFLE